MPRLPKHRNCRQDSATIFYKPTGIPMHQLECEYLQLDEFEAMRLCDLDGLDQIEAGEKMGVSRGTIQRLLETGRARLIRTLLEKKALQVGAKPSCCVSNENCQDTTNL